MGIVRWGVEIGMFCEFFENEFTNFQLLQLNSVSGRLDAI